MTNKEYTEYREKKITEAIVFSKDLDLRKSMAEKAIKERSNEVIQNIISKNNVDISINNVKYQEEIDLIKEINKASFEGDYKLVQELMNKL